MSKRRRKNHRGYTAVEVLVAMTLFAIGAAGVIGMQRATVQGGEDARRLDTGTNIANEWVGRLQRDATQWTQPSALNPTTNNINLTRWVQQVNTAACNPPAFCTPQPDPATPQGFSYAFDIFGRDLDPATNKATYCVQYRMWWGRPPGNAPFNEEMAVNADVRVFWSRLEQAPIGNCKTPTVQGKGPDDPNAPLYYHFVRVSTVLRRTQESPQ